MIVIINILLLLCIDQELRQSLVDMGYISSLLSEKQSIVDSPDAVPMEILAPRDGPSSVEFKDVSFVYPYDYETATDSKPTGNTPADANPIQRDGMLLNRLTFKIEKGQNVAIVGPSGSGKYF